MYINHSRKNQWPRRPGGIDRFGCLPLNGARLMMRTTSRPDRHSPAAYRNRWFARHDEHEQAARPILITDYGPSR
jgi:hypothetical protein